MATNQPTTQLAYEYDGLLDVSQEAAATDAPDNFYLANDDEQSLPIRIIRAGKSANTITGYDYPASAIEEATPLFDGVHVYRNHMDPSSLRASNGIRRIEDKVGILQLPRYNPKAQAVDGRLLVFDTSEYNRFKRGKSAYGVSMYGEVNAPPPGRTPRTVSKIVSVRSVDIVDRPGAGGGISPAFEAAMKEIIAMAEPTTTQPVAEAAAAPTSVAELMTAMQTMMKRLDKLEAAQSADAADDKKSKAQEQASQQDELAQAKAELASVKRQMLVGQLASEVNAKLKLPATVLALAQESFAAPAGDDSAVRTALEAHFGRYAAAIPAPAASPSRTIITGQGESQALAQESAANHTAPQKGLDLAEFRAQQGWGQ